MEKIKISYGNEQVGAIEILKKEETEQKILELFNTKEITKVNITYKEEPVQLCTSSNNVEISQEEANELIKQSKGKYKEIIQKGGKLTKTVIEEKDRTIEITKIEPVEGKATSSIIIQTKEGIIINPWWE